MYEEVMAAYLSEDSIKKVSAQSGFRFGIEDFSVTLLFSADTPGVLVSCLERVVGKNTCKGWYLALRDDATIVFQLSDGQGSCSAVSSAIEDCFDGYLFHLAAVRSGGALKLYLEGELIGRSASGSSARLDVSCDGDLVFGGSGLEELGEAAYNGLAQCVTLWSRELPESLFDFTASDVLPRDRSGLQGWWPLDGSLTDRGPHSCGITYCENVSYYPVFNLAEAESESGYRYGNVEQTGQTSNTPILSRRLSDETGTDKLRRRITVSVDQPGVFFGSCAAQSPALAYPQGVTLKVTSPSGKSLSDMTTTDKQLIVLEGEQVYQFIFLEPELGNWILELTAEAGSSFALDYQFIPNGTTREQLTQTMNDLYPQYLGSTLADDPTPTLFLFSTLAKVLTYEINRQLTERKNGNHREALTADPVVVGFVGIAAIAGLCCYVLYKGISAIYHWLTDPSPAPTPTPTPKPEPAYQYDWKTVERELHGFYSYTESTLRLYSSIQTKLGGKVPQDPADYYTRKDLEALGSDMRLHLDIGGEGCFWYGGMLSGFPGAINLNVQMNNSQMKRVKIPFLIHLDHWRMKWPFESGSVDRITSQGTEPYNEVEREEAARCIRKVKGARIDIWTSTEFWQDFKLDEVAEKIRELVKETDLLVRVVERAQDPEFGNYVEGFAKYSVVIY